MRLPYEDQRGMFVPGSLQERWNIAMMPLRMIRLRHSVNLLENLFVALR
jgi:hypothetical protein